MTVLQRTDLTTSQKIQCAAAAVAGQHAHGSKTALSETYEISRPTVYAVGAAAESVLRSHFESPLLQGAAVDVRVDDAQLRRAVVALRVLAPNAIRPIEDLVPLLYPGVKVSYGTIQQMLVETEARAARFNAQASLGGVEAGALDEMFSQGEPVLAGVDLDSGYLFGLSLSATRDGEAWAELLREGQCQGLELSVVVKDAAKGIAAGVSEVFPQAEQRDDCFHVLYEMNKVRRRKAKRELSSVRRECAEAIERFDEFEAAMDTLRGALECVDINTGELHRPEHVQALIEGVAQRIESLGVREAREVPAQPGAGVGAGAKERVAPARGVGRAVVGAGGELGVPVLVLGPGAAQASCARPASCAVSSSARRLRGTARPTWRGERIAARGRRGGAAPAPSRLECHRGVQCGTAPLSLRPQGRHSGLSRPVPCLVQSAHAALGTAQGDQCSRVPDRTAGPRLAHAARLSALADTALIHGRCRALALLDTPRPRALRASGQAQLVCVKMNHRILIGAQRDNGIEPEYRSLPRPERRAAVNSLYVEQTGQCVYCGRKVSLARLKVYHIEHFRPRSNYPELELDYSNLFLSCGPASEDGTRETCGNHKDDWFEEDCQVPPAPESCAERFRFRSSGEIAGDDTSEADKMIQVLNLNHPELVTERQVVIEDLERELKSGVLLSELRQDYLDLDLDLDRGGARPSFANVAIGYLKAQARAEF